MVLVFSACAFVATAQEVAYARNDDGVVTNSVNDETENFILTSAVARLIGAEEGRLAAEKGTTREMRAYGVLVVKDQKRLLGELKRLAVLKNLTIPEDINETELAGKSGRRFNVAFLKTMTAELERDRELFHEATMSADPDVAAFAVRYLPLIESHLKKIRSIRKGW
jgi:putative membrane protein